MTVDEIFAPSNAGNAYSIQDVLAAIGSQYQPRQTGSIDEILSQMSLGYEPIQAKVMPTGAGQYITGQPISEAYTPSEFDFDALKMEYESAADKAQRVYNETYASQIAAGKSQAEAQAQAQKEYQRAAMVGSMAGAAIGRAYGGPIGGMIGARLGAEAAPIIEPVTNLASNVVGGAKNFVNSLLDW